MAAVPCAPRAGLLTWVWLLDGREGTAPGGLGGQCVDLANLWLEHEGRALVRLNACDWGGRQLPGMLWTPNGAANYPAAGDVVVWRSWGGHGIGAFGHIAVCVAADGMALATFDQNWPAGSPCRLVSHDFIGVMGWQVVQGAARS